MKNAVLVENIPQALRTWSQWIVWRYETRPGEEKPTKVLYCPQTGRKARTHDDPGKSYPDRPQDTWTTFEEALRVYQDSRGRYAGIGFVFTADDPFAGLDLDDCLGENGDILPWAAPFVSLLDSYAEVSPSGRGLKIFVMARKPGDRCRTGDFEFYDQARYFTVTGNRLPGCPADVQDRQAQYTDAYTRVFGPLEKPTPARPSSRSFARSELLPDDADLLSKACQGAHGAMFAALYAGDTSAYGGDESRADMALCARLAFWTGADAYRMDRLFRASGLMRLKWDEKRGQMTYGERTLKRAIERCTEVYDPLSRDSAARLVYSVPDAPAAAEESEISDLTPGEESEISDSTRTEPTEEDAAQAINPLLELHRRMAGELARRGIRLTLKGVRFDSRVDETDLQEAAKMLLRVRDISEGCYRYWLCAMVSCLPKKRGARKHFLLQLVGDGPAFMQLNRQVNEWLPVYRKIPSDVWDWRCPWYVLDAVAHMEPTARAAWLEEARTEGRITRALRKRAVGDKSTMDSHVDINVELSLLSPEDYEAALRLEETAQRVNTRSDKLLRLMAERARKSRPEPEQTPPIEEAPTLDFSIHQESQGPPLRTFPLSLEQEAMTGLELLARQAGMSVVEYLNSLGLAALAAEESEISDSTEPIESAEVPEFLTEAPICHAVVPVRTERVSAIPPMEPPEGEEAVPERADVPDPPDLAALPTCLMLDTAYWEHGLEESALLLNARARGFPEDLARSQLAALVAQGLLTRRGARYQLACEVSS